MAGTFDEVAHLYDSSLRPLPDEYVRLIGLRFNIRTGDRIIDLGCGSGLLTIPLSRFSDHVEGLDISRKLLGIARFRDVENRVNWLESPVETFEFGVERYSLIMSFESFHLFPEPVKLLRKCELALKRSGYFCVGWCNYHWEEKLKETIIKVFESFGIQWGEWGYQGCSYLQQTLERSRSDFRNVYVESIESQTEDSFSEIARFLASIDKASPLGIEGRKRLAHELQYEFETAFASQRTSGSSSYCIAYCQKSFAQGKGQSQTAGTRSDNP